MLSNEDPSKNTSKEMSESGNWRTIALIEPDYIDQTGALAKPIILSGGVSLGPIPGWIWDERVTGPLAKYSDEIHASRYAITVEYTADSLGDPDTKWSGQGQRSKQEAALETIVFANMAIWIAKPCRVGSSLVLHCDENDGKWWCVQCHHVQPLVPLDEYVEASLLEDEIDTARLLHARLMALPAQGTIRIAGGTLWSALYQKKADIRYLFLWITLEAIFAPEKQGKLSYRLAQRIARFLTTDEKERKSTFKEVREAYELRCEIVHGMRIQKFPPERMQELMFLTEQWIVMALKRILLDQNLVRIFNEGSRDSYLTELVLGI